MSRGIVKYMATLAITAVCGGCHNTSATVEDTLYRFILYGCSIALYVTDLPWHPPGIKSDVDGGDLFSFSCINIWQNGNKSVPLQ